MPKRMLKWSVRCISAVADGITGLVHASKRCILRLVKSEPTQQAIVFVSDGFHKAVPKLYYTAGALIGTVEGLWLEGRVLVHEFFDLDSASHKAWQSPIRYSYYDFRPAHPVNPFVLFNTTSNSWNMGLPPSQGPQA